MRSTFLKKNQRVSHVISPCAEVKVMMMKTLFPHTPGLCLRHPRTGTVGLPPSLKGAGGHTLESAPQVTFPLPQRRHGTHFGGRSLLGQLSRRVGTPIPPGREPGAHSPLALESEDLREGTAPPSPRNLLLLQCKHPQLEAPSLSLETAAPRNSSPHTSVP